MRKHPTPKTPHSTSNGPALRFSPDVRRWMFVVGWLLLFNVAAFSQETEVQYLSGHGKDDAVPWKFFCSSGAKSGYWTTIPVPSCWELQGFGTLSYYRDATNAYQEFGLYEHDFTVPKEWSGRRIFLVFDGSMTDTAAKINGRSVGPLHQGAYYRFKYEVSSLIHAGAVNKLEVTVAKHSANASVNGAERTGDFWMYGGIFRPVTLEAVPQQYIDHVAMDARADGTFSASVFVAGITNAYEVEAQIETLDGRAVGKPFRDGIIFSGMGFDVSHLKSRIHSPKLWTAETPNLYQVEIRLKRGDTIVHKISRRFGFRTFEVRDRDGLYLNGRRIILKGCNRHSFWPDSGRCLSDAVQRLDVESIKDMNMNAVRMSHYPPDAKFLELCDELGLYVLDELGGWHKFYDNETGKRLVGEMVVRDVNHPSILFWDNGNEGGFNTNLDTVFAKYDPQQRRVLHPWAPFSGLNTAHYLAYETARVAAEGKAMYYRKGAETVDATLTNKYIYMPTEFLHGLYDGGAGAGLDDYWRMMMSGSAPGGGFIWAYLDEGVRRPDTGKIDVSGNQAPDGIVGPYREREASFYTIKQIWSPIPLTLTERTPSHADIKIENHYSFTDVHDCKLTWQLRRFPGPDETTNDLVVAKGMAKAPGIPAGASGQWRLRFPKNGSDADLLAVRVDDPAGHELWTYTWPLRQRKVLADNVPVIARADFNGINNGPVDLKGAGITARINGGELISVEYDGKMFSLTNGPRAVGTNIVLKQISWQLHSNGWLSCDYTFSAEGTNSFFGVVFDYPETLVAHKRWFGDGPYRVWQNRLKGVTPGLWENDYNDTITGWRGWVYPEFKGCFSNVRWLQLETIEGQITVVPENVPFVQVLTPAFPPTNLVGKAFAPLARCGLGLLNAIPPIGSKFKDARAGGPQGQPAIAHGDYHGSVSFYFGTLP